MGSCWQPAGRGQRAERGAARDLRHRCAGADLHTGGGVGARGEHPGSGAPVVGIGDGGAIKGADQSFVLSSLSNRS